MGLSVEGEAHHKGGLSVLCRTLVPCDRTDGMGMGSGVHLPERDYQPTHTSSVCMGSGSSVQQSMAAQFTQLAGKVLLHHLTLTCLPAGCLGALRVGDLGVL